MLINYEHLVACVELTIIEYLKCNDGPRQEISEKVLRNKMNIFCSGGNSYTANIPVSNDCLHEKLQSSYVTLIVDFSLTSCGSSILINNIKIDMPFLSNIEYPSDYILRSALQ